MRFEQSLGLEMALTFISSSFASVFAFIALFFPRACNNPQLSQA